MNNLSNKYTTAYKSTDNTEIHTSATNISTVSMFPVAMMGTQPRPLLAPMNSPTMAPTTASVMATSAAAIQVAQGRRAVSDESYCDLVDVGLTDCRCVRTNRNVLARSGGIPFPEARGANRSCGVKPIRRVPWPRAGKHQGPPGRPGKRPRCPARGSDSRHAQSSCQHLPPNPKPDAR